MECIGKLAKAAADEINKRRARPAQQNPNPNQVGRDDGLSTSALQPQQRRGLKRFRNGNAVRKAAEDPTLRPSNTPEQPNPQARACRTAVDRMVGHLASLQPKLADLAEKHPVPGTPAGAAPSSPDPLQAELDRHARTCVASAHALLTDFSLDGVLDGLDPGSAHLAQDLQTAIQAGLGKQSKFNGLDHARMASDIMAVLLAHGSLCHARRTPPGAEQRIHLGVAATLVRSTHARWDSQDKIQSLLLGWTPTQTPEAKEEATRNDQIRALLLMDQEVRSDRLKKKQDISSDSSESIQASVKTRPRKTTAVSDDAPGTTRPGARRASTTARQPTKARTTHRRKNALGPKSKADKAAKPTEGARGGPGSPVGSGSGRTLNFSSSQSADSESE